ncbi:hypothetical protein PMIN02_011214, partial [Paraphaeosphaeria minitans]
AITISGVTGNLPVVGGLTSGLTGGSSPIAGVANTVSGVTGNLPVVGGLTSGLTGGSSPVAGVANAVSGVTNGLPVVGGVTGGLTGGVGNPLGAVGGVVGTVTNTVGSLPVVGGVVAPVVGAVGGVTSGNPLGAVGGAVSGALGTVGQVAGSVPVVGGAVQGAVNTVGQTVNSALLGPYPLNQGVPGSDPVGGLSISIIATLLSLLKKDPMSLFGGGLGGIGGLIKRDLPELADQLEIEKRSLSHTHKKRQLSLPSLSSGVPGVGLGALPLSGVPGTYLILPCSIHIANHTSRRLPGHRLPRRLHRQKYRRPRRQGPRQRHGQHSQRAQRRCPQLPLQVAHRSRFGPHLRLPPAPICHQPRQVRLPC